MQRKLFVLAITLVVGVGGSLACTSKDDTQPPLAPTTSSVATTSANLATGSQPSATAKSTAAPITEAISCTDVQKWPTGPRQSSVMSAFELYNVRKGAGDCFDRVVFDINGAAPVGYHVEYVAALTEDGSGHAVFVEGDAVLQVVIRAQLQGQDSSGHQPGRLLATPGAYFYPPGQLVGYKSLRAIRFANFFEGQSTIGIGVARQLPFRVQTWVDGDQIMHVIVDIAHP